MRKIVYLLTLILSLSAKAQDPLYKSLNQLTGLPSNTVYNIKTDKKGFIWIGHNKGLTKYDGRRYINYINTTKQNVAISNLLEYDGKIWCQDFSGNFYYIRNDSLILEKNIQTIGSFSYALLFNGNLVYTQFDSIHFYDIKNKRSSAFFLKDSATHGICAARNNIYLSTYNGVTCYTDQKVTLPIRNRNTTQYLLNINNSIIGFNKSEPPYVINFSNNSIINIPLPKNLFINDVCLIDSEIWLCTSVGAYCFDMNFNIKYSKTAIYSNSSISGVCKDKEGGYWFSTLNNGLYYVPFIDVKNYSIQNTFTTIQSANDKIFCGTSKGEVFSLSNDSISVYRKIPVAHEINRIIIDKKVLACGIGFSNLSEKNIRNYAATYSVKDASKIDDEIYAIATSNGAFIALGNSSLKNKVPISLLQFLSNSKYIGLLNIDNNYNRCRSILYSKSCNTLYIAYQNGLYCFNPNGKFEIKFNKQTINTSRLYEYNNIVYATTNYGILTLSNQLATKINTENILTDLSNNTKCAFSNNIVWILNNGFLYSFNLSTKKAFKHRAISELTQADINEIAIDDSNNFYLATTTGIIKFNPINIDSAKNISEIFLADFLVNNERVAYSDNLILDTKKNNITIDFAVNNYRQSNLQTIYYKLNNNNWVALPSNAFSLNLNELNYGTHTVIIKAVLQNGTVTQKPLELSFTIKTPIHKQIWFLILISSLVLSLIIIYYKIELRKITYKNKLIADKLRLEEELQSSMMASIKSQMNPHFLFNALNTIQSYIYTNDKINATQYLSKFSNLTRRILEMSNKEKILLSEEIDALKLYIDLEKMRFDDTLTYDFFIDKNLDLESIYIPSMLIQPYVENAIKHGLLHKKDNRFLKVSFEKSETSLHITITDNGIGRKKSGILNQQKNKQHTSFAMIANRKRLEILQKQSIQNVDLVIIDNENELNESTGTTVIVKLPITTRLNNTTK